MKMEEVLNECRDVVEQVCAKFGYDDEDKDGKDSLKTVLLKIIPIMLKDSNLEARNLFYQMLSHTPIVITENLTQESYDKLLKQYIGKNINEHIIEEDADLGEYGKAIGAGAFVAEPILGKDMSLQGKKSFIYIQKITGNASAFLGSHINIPHLIHELGHAWHAEKDQFVMQSNGTLRERIGTAEFIYAFSKTPDNKFVKKCTKVTGLMIEEGMNTVAEEMVMSNYMDIPLEEMQKAYRTALIPSNYQGFIADFVTYMLKKLGKDSFENYRLYGETESKDKINALMEKTNYWKNREADTLSSSNSPRNYAKKRAALDKINSTSVQEFFDKYQSVYFPNISTMTPFEKIDNVLTQKYNLNMVRYSMGLDNYKAFLEILGYEGYSLINQAATLDKSEEITPSSALKNALEQGITIAQTVQANVIENSVQNLKHNKEGATKDD